MSKLAIYVPAAGLAAILALGASAADAATPEYERAGGILVGDAVYFPHDDCIPREVHERGVVFVNFDGGTIFYSDYDDAVDNRSRLFSGDWPAYGDGPAREQVMAELTQMWADFNVVLTTSRPGSGPYTMVMVGPEFIVEGGALGVAPVDCNDTVPQNVVYAFLSVDDGLTPSDHAWTISHEVAHSYGLDHVSQPDDVMAESLGFGEASFIENCHGLVAGPNGIGCAEQHEASCDAGEQNSWQDIHAIFGDQIVDTIAPTVEVLSPNDQDELDADAQFTINVDADDDTLVDSVEIHWIGEVPVELDPSGKPFRWTLDEGLPMGGYSFYATATDLAGNEAHSEVINIGIGGATPPDVDEVPEDPEDGTGDGDEGGTGDESSEDSPAGDEEGASQGCGCRTTSAPVSGLALLALVLGFVRRRPSASFS